MSLLASAAARKSPLLRWAAGGWTFFILENAVLSENRTYLIQQLGDDQYHAVYGTFSTIASASIGYALYKIKRTKTTIPSNLVLWKKAARPPMASMGLSFLFLSTGLVMASQVAPKLQIPVGISQHGPNTQFQVRCPFDFSDKHNNTNNNVRGLERITRHPGLWAFGFIGLGQSFLAWNMPLRVWWTGPAMVAWMGGWHTDSRFRRGMGGTLPPEYDCQTSNLPFVAMLTGKQGSGCWSALANEIKPLNAGLGVA
ncbi:MAG: hypothetical protein SGARI_005696, partial [Bacillariaceae sp.]